jgi:hypothetical protein
MNVAKFLQEGCLVWTLTTNGYKFFTLNLYRSIEACKVPWKLCIVCGDKASYRFFMNEGISCVLAPNVPSESGSRMLLFGSKPFQEINLVKLNCLASFAKDSSIKVCVYIDGDIFIQKDILSDIRPRLEINPLLFQCDGHGDKCEEPCTNVCSGVIAWKHGEDKGIFEVKDKKKWQEAPEDQLWVNRMLRETQIPYSTLPVLLYPNGTHSQTPPSDFYLLHYNWLVGGAKITRMKKNAHWRIPYS